MLASTSHRYEGVSFAGSPQAAAAQAAKAVEQLPGLKRRQQRVSLPFRLISQLM